MAPVEEKQPLMSRTSSFFGADIYDCKSNFSDALG